jgi:hypothetical protein
MRKKITGVLAFEARRSEVASLADHKAQNGGKTRVSKRGKGVRVAFGREADIAAWEARAERAANGKSSPA